jgi:hypothetical protein
MAGRPAATSLEPVHQETTGAEVPEMLTQPLPRETSTARREALLNQAAHARLVREARVAAATRPSRSAVLRLRVLRLRPVHV